MNDKKYQIFISSTYADLKDERQAAMNSVIDLRHIPIGMEGFPAIDQEQMSYIKRLIDECDYYILLIKNRYGSQGEGGISFTEQEYDYAVQQGKHILVFMNDELDTTEADESTKLADFKKKAATGRLVRFWTSKVPLELLVFKSLSAAFEADPRTGWVRGDAAIDPATLVKLEAATSKIQRLEEEIAELKAPPRVENLAGIEDRHIVPYTVNVRISVRTVEYKKINKTFDLTWNQYFILIGPTYRVGRTPTAIDTPLEEYLKQAGQPTYRFNITSHERVKVLNQMELLGLMKSTVAQSTEGKMGVFYQLTELGEQTLKVGIAVTS